MYTHTIHQKERKCVEKKRITNSICNKLIMYTSIDILLPLLVVIS